MSIQKRLILTGAIFGGLAVAFGAFGAHALKDLLSKNGRIETYELAVRYQFYHAFALLIMGALTEKLNSRSLSWASILITFGTMVFSGSLYILSLTGITTWGAVTPLGGALLIIGWIFLALATKK